MHRTAVQDLAAAAHAADRCHDCAICGKPFTAARVPKAAGIFGDDHFPGQAALYLLCRECARLSRREKIERLSTGARGALLAAARPMGRA